MVAVKGAIISVARVPIAFIVAVALMKMFVIIILDENYIGLIIIVLTC